MIEPVSFSLYATDFDAFAQRLGAAFERYGFAVVSDHGLDQARIEEAQGQAQAFFALPDATKRAYVTGPGGQRGYVPFGVETAKGASAHDLKEFWHVGRDLSPGHPYSAVMAPNVWPDETPDFRASQIWLFNALDHLGGQILEAVARYLDLPRDAFAAATTDGNSILRLLHYPPITGEGPNLRAGPHEDINAITLLLGAEEAGLEILERDGSWLAVNPPPGAVVCNIGDMLARAAGGRLVSTTHRVANPGPDARGRSRYSTPFFLHFAPDHMIEALPGGDPDKAQPPITAQAFLEERLKEIRLL